MGDDFSRALAGDFTKQIFERCSQWNVCCDNPLNAGFRAEIMEVDAILSGLHLETVHNCNILIRYRNKRVSSVSHLVNLRVVK